MKLKVSEAKRALKIAIKGQLLKNSDNVTYLTKPMYRMPIYLEGPPGVGKSEICSQVAKELKIGYVSYSLVHHTRNSVLGLPVIKSLQDGRKYTKYTMSEIIAAVNNQVELGKNEGVLMLDEFPCISDAIAPIMLAFLQSKTIGEYKLPDGWVIVLAGNPKEFNKSVRSMDMATLDRIRLIEIKPDVDDYISYAESDGVHPVIIDYLSINSNNCYKVINNNAECPECVTFRSWSNLSVAMRSYELMDAENEIDSAFIMQFIKDETIAEHFFEYYKKTRHSISIEDLLSIYDGKANEKIINNLLCENYSEKFRLSKMMINYTINHSMSLVKNGTNKSEVSRGIENMYEFLDRIDDSGSLSESLTDSINNSHDMIMTMRELNVPSYKKRIMKKYDVA